MKIRKKGPAGGTSEPQRHAIQRLCQEARVKVVRSGQVRVVSLWIRREIRAMRKRRLERAFLATNHGVSYRKPGREPDSEPQTERRNKETK
jgi:hypothetical protein